MRYVRNMRGYGANPPDPKWPGGAHVAVQFVVNYEEGGENCILHGDAASEAFLSEITGAAPWQGLRHWNMESIYEYGARAGFWRLHRLFTGANVPVTCYGVASALARSPDQLTAMQEAGWEIATHGLKWIDYRDHPADLEKQDIKEAIRLHTEVTGERPSGWYTGRTSDNTVRLVAEEGGFAYCSDTYDDDLPYWLDHDGHGKPIAPLLIIPYTLDANDMRFGIQAGFSNGEQFLTYLKDAFDTLYAEGNAGQPKMMTIGLHCRLIGRPGRFGALKRFVEYVQSHDRVWLPRRIDIARHWHEHHPYETPKLRPSRMGKADFVTAFGGVFEHSPWIAERAYELELGAVHDTAGGLHNALCRAFRTASEAERLGVLSAHPDLAGKLAEAKRLTAESAKEQASAGLDALTDSERQKFIELNRTYVEKFGFPFIIAVKGRSKADILAAFEARIGNDRDTEFTTACRQVERIALLRLKDMLPE
ncbi:allantoinase PuuE [Manganibacter manganicus]|uniref:Chitooligosaccharide deacetylase n=1 Tax=Manganibacter manganicus TaxID=1873176 RepID=A0A1V8RNX9_9HYPH|nr:allantoinase PuuE [Pseudaminobacter manganicus]OQM74900.1 OHCU decarboxylase [Pseudaminobacter manganicus]